MSTKEIIPLLRNYFFSRYFTQYTIIILLVAVAYICLHDYFFLKDTKCGCYGKYKEKSTTNESNDLF